MKTIGWSVLLVCLATSTSAWAGPWLGDALVKENYGHPKPVPQVSTDQFQAYRNDPTTLIVDRRGDAEWELGHVRGIENLPGKTTAEHVAAVAELVEANPDIARVISMCSGPYCHASINLTNALTAAQQDPKTDADKDFAEVCGDCEILRYQAGNPVWKVLSGEPMQIESEAIPTIYEDDQTALFFYATPADDSGQDRELPTGTSELDATDLKALHKVIAGPTPPSRYQHNTRIICFGENGDDAYALGKALAENAFVNVTFFDGTFDEFKALLP